MKEKNRCTHSFTLIELLTVIAIIGVLAALLFPAIKSALLKAEKTKAQTAIAGLETAFKAYYTEYGKWPIADLTPPAIGYKVDSFMVGLLCRGSNVVSIAGATGTYNGNPRGIIFLEVKPAALSSSGDFADPWGTVYYCTFDTAYNNQITDPLDTSKTLSAGFLVWSYGPDAQWDATGDASVKNKDNVKSW